MTRYMFKTLVIEEWRPIDLLQYDDLKSAMLRSPKSYEGMMITIIEEPQCDCCLPTDSTVTFQGLDLGPSVPFDPKKGFFPHNPPNTCF